LSESQIEKIKRSHGLEMSKIKHMEGSCNGAGVNEKDTGNFEKDEVATFIIYLHVT